jgi:hypothetical protein
MLLEINANPSAFSSKADPCVKESHHFSSVVIYSIYYGNEGTSSSVSEVDRYFIIISSVDYIFNIYEVFTLWWEIHTHAWHLFRKVACTMYDVHLFVKQIDFKKLY